MRSTLISVIAVSLVEFAVGYVSSSVVLPFDRQHHCQESSRNSDAFTHHRALLGDSQILLASGIERFFAYGPDLGWSRSRYGRDRSSRFPMSTRR